MEKLTTPRRKYNLLGTLTSPSPGGQSIAHDFWRVVRGIPRGFWNTAQGCDAGATLGKRTKDLTNRNAVVADQTITTPVRFVATPLALSPFGANEPKVGTGVSTLGWRPMPLWGIQDSLSSCE